MVKISPIDPNTLAPQTFLSEDSNIIQSTITSSLFNVKTDTVEYFIYDLNNNLLVSNPNYNNWSVINDPSLTSTKDSISTIEIDPVIDLNNFGYNFGAVKSVYNFVSNKLTSSPTNRFYISEISSDRTELRLKSNFISNDSLQIAYEQFKFELNSSEFFDEFYLNFGGNQLVLAVNILLDNSTSQYSLLIKLYSALPQTFQLKTETYVVTKSAESIGFEVEFENIVDVTAGLNYIKPANFNLDIFDQINNTTDYKNYNTLLNTNNSSSLYQLINYISGSDIQVNVDYSDYNNFINFSSAAQRLFNFQTKIYNISASQAQLNTLSSSISGPTSASIVVSSSKAILEDQIQTTIGSFDKYEYYLYYNSESKSWPKQNSTAPYILFDPTSSQAINWYSTQSVTASLYDSNNQNYLYYTIPQFIREDSSNDPYLVFVDLVGQLFDEIWLYTKNITDKLDSNNNLNLGVSKDIVADVLKSLGIKLYASNFTADNIYNTLIGVNPNGGSLLPTGSELITNYVTSSISASLVPTIDDYNKLIYKKIYHNLPYLLKKKGTPQGLKALINIFGIPSTILRINEFGGKDKNLNTYDSWEDEFNYAFYTTGSGAINVPFKVSPASFGSTFPKAISFRFKTDGLPTGSINYSQSLAVTQNNRFMISLEYTGSGYTSGSYNGSIIDPNYQYATLKFISGSQSASVYLPFFNGDWWSVLVNADSGSSTTYTLYAKNKIYKGEDGKTIGFQASSSFIGNLFWSNAGTTQLIFPTGSTLNGKTYLPFSGAYQEIRYYRSPLNESAFNAYVMNPYSIEGNDISNSQSSKNILMFRLPLGGELFTNSSSIHPAITGSYTPTQSFNANPQTASFVGSYSFIPNTETIFFDQPSVGIQNIISDKIRISDIILPFTGSIETNIPENQTLSKYISVQQNYSISSSYTNDINYTEIAFSPQNEINEDIMSSLGYFNIGDYIGDPRQISSSNVFYPDLDVLRNLYFEKYSSNYDWNDFIRLIKFFDNSLFKLLKDFIPAKSSLASGIVIKQHLLERNKYPIPQLNTYTTTSYSSGSTWNTPSVQQDILLTASIVINYISGSSGGSVPNLYEQTSSTNYFSNITQSWTGFNTTPSGSIPFIQSNQNEFFDGEFSGSLINIKLDEEGYQPNIVTLYTASVLPVAPTITFSSGSKFPIPYEIDYNKTYYLSFNYGNMTAGNFISIVDNTNKVLFQTVNSPGSGSVITEIKEAFYPISILTNNNFPPNLSASNVLIQEYQLTNPSLDPLANNVLDNRLSSEYMDVDYSSNAILPVNSASLYSGSATKFAIPDSNYTSYRSTALRYEGSKTTSPGFNQPIYIKPSTIFLNNQYPVSTPSTESQVPNASNYSNWFIYFDYVQTSFPEIPNGGNVHAVYAINTEGQAISLTENNTYVSEISNIFSSGTLATILPLVYASGKKNPQVTIFDGGAKYITICTLSGSSYTAGAWGQVNVGGNINSTYLTTGSNKSQLFDNVDTTNEIVPLQTANNEWMRDGVLQSNQQSFTYIPFGDFGIYDQRKETIIFNTNINNNTSVEGIYTYFPLKYGDLIRFGDARAVSSTTSSLASGSLDYSFSGLGLYNIVSSLRESAPANPSTLFIFPAITQSITSSILGGANKGNPTSNTVFVNQNWRIFRRVPDETNITIATLPTYKDPGLLVPENFNPDYDPYDLARKAGIIT